MAKIRIGILGASDIAFRRFLPALKSVRTFEFAGVAVADYREWGAGLDEKSYEPLLAAKREKARKFIDNYGGKIYVGYENLIRSEDVDAVYIPLPPSLHFRWCQEALSAGKHVLSEKPCTTSLKDTMELVDLAQAKGLALYENYAFGLHRQIFKIRELIEEGKIGELRLIRSAFGFPYRSAEDFRYDQKMGGGALLDCGGYVLKAVQLFTGGDVEVVTSALHYTDRHDVDMYGSAVLIGKNQVEAQSASQITSQIASQIAFGMDNSYKCELEIWGSQACIFAPRIFTPPAEMETQIIVKGQSEEIIKVMPDDQFAHAIEYFGSCIENPEARETAGKEILAQSRLVDEMAAKNILRLS